MCIISKDQIIVTFWSKVTPTVTIGVQDDFTKSLPFLA